jgi:hypothetical protein
MKIVTTFTVDTDELDRAINLISALNSSNIKHIVWKRKGETLKPVDEPTLEEWGFIGLSNEYYYRMFLKEDDEWSENK